MPTAARPTASCASHAPSDLSRIGPNASIQTAGVLRDRIGEERAATLLLQSTGYDLYALPTDMVDEREPLALVQAVRQEFGPSHCAAIMREAGQRFNYRETPAGTELTFGSCAMCRGMLSSVSMCDFYAGTFKHLVQVLVSDTVYVVEVECIAHGGRCCRFARQGMT